MDWHAVVVDGVTYHWTAYPTHYRIEEGPLLPCIALSVVLEPGQGGGVAATFPPEKVVTEGDAIEVVRTALEHGPFPGSVREWPSSLVPFTFDAVYEDSGGRDAIVIRVGPRSVGKNTPMSYGFETTIRGVAFHGADLDGMSAVDPALARAAGFPVEKLTKFVLEGELPCAVSVGGKRIDAPLRFTLDSRGDESVLAVRIDVHGKTCEVADEWFRSPSAFGLGWPRLGASSSAAAPLRSWHGEFEDALLGLARALPSGAHLVACVT